VTDHNAAAEEYLALTRERDWAEERSYVELELASAQVHAALYLAEQQRIANQLRAAELRVDKPWVMSDIERLGLS